MWALRWGDYPELSKWHELLKKVNLSQQNQKDIVEKEGKGEIQRLRRFPLTTASCEDGEHGCEPGMSAASGDRKYPCLQTKGTGLSFTTQWSEISFSLRSFLKGRQPSNTCFPPG